MSTEQTCWIGQMYLNLATFIFASQLFVMVMKTRHKGHGKGDKCSARSGEHTNNLVKRETNIVVSWGNVPWHGIAEQSDSKRNPVE